jgi:hypothetical protein
VHCESVALVQVTAEVQPVIAAQEEQTRSLVPAHIVLSYCPWVQPGAQGAQVSTRSSTR